MHETVKRTYEVVDRPPTHAVGGASDYGTPQVVYETQSSGRSYTQPPKFNYPSSTSYSDNWPYSSESHQAPPQHTSGDLPTTHSDPAYYHTPSSFEEYSYATSGADMATSKTVVSIPEERSSSRHSYAPATDYSDELTSQMSKLDVNRAQRSYQTPTDSGDYTSSTSLGQGSTSSAYSTSSVDVVTTVDEPPLLQTSSRYDTASSSWYDGSSSSRYDVTSGPLYEATASGHHGGYGSISSTPSSSGMTVTSGSGYPVVPTACSNTEQQLRERVRQLEQMVQQKDVQIEEQRSVLKYSGPQKLYQDHAVISPAGPASLYSSGSLSSPHHSGLLQHAYGTPPSISPQATMQHVGYYPHAGAPAGTAYYSAQPTHGYSSHRWSGPLSAPMTGGQYPSPPGSLATQQTITPPGTHLVSVLHSGPIQLVPTAATPTQPPPRQVSYFKKKKKILCKINFMEHVIFSLAV